MAENEQNQSGDVAGGGAAAVTKPSATERVQRALDGGAVDKPGEVKPGEAKPQRVKPGEKKPDTAAAAEGFVSKADAQQMIQEGIKAAMEASKGERASADVRQQYIIKNMGDLPGFAQDLIPTTGDLKELAKAEQGVREQLGQWIVKLIEAGNRGLKLTPDGRLKSIDVGGASREGGQTPNSMTVLQASEQGMFSGGGKMSPTQRVHQALNKRG